MNGCPTCEGGLASGAQRQSGLCAPARPLRFAVMSDLDPWPYLTDHDAALLPSLVAYVDTLGSRKAMAKLTNAGLHEHLALFGEAKGGLWAADVPKIVVSFSDNLAIASPLGHMDTDGALRILIYAVARYQSQMLRQSKFTRGGLTTGPLYARNDIIIGPALVAAVELEEQVSVFPRVLVDDATIKLVQGMWRDSLLAVDGDGRVFINYLREELSYPDAISHVRQVITSALNSDAASSRSIREKYVWLAQYFNWVVSGCPNPNDAAVVPEVRGLEYFIKDGLSDTECRYPRTFSVYYGSE
jgi:hypothetical protein